MVELHLRHAPLSRDDARFMVETMTRPPDCVIKVLGEDASEGVWQFAQYTDAVSAMVELNARSAFDARVIDCGEELQEVANV